MSDRQPILQGKNLVKRYGRVTALDHCDFELYPGEILAVIGDNGAGKSSLIKAVSGAVIPDEGEVYLDGTQVHFHSPIDAREAGIETVYQTLAMSPALSITDNMFMGREIRKPGFMGKYLRQLDKKAMERFARDKLPPRRLGQRACWPSRRRMPEAVRRHGRRSGTCPRDPAGAGRVRRRRALRALR